MRSGRRLSSCESDSDLPKKIGIENWLPSYHILLSSKWRETSLPIGTLPNECFLNPKYSNSAQWLFSKHYANFSVACSPDDDVVWALLTADAPSRPPFSHCHLHFSRPCRGAEKDTVFLCFRAHHHPPNRHGAHTWVLEKTWASVSYSSPPVLPLRAFFFLIGRYLRAANRRIKYFAVVYIKTVDVLWCGKSPCFKKERRSNHWSTHARL